MCRNVPDLFLLLHPFDHSSSVLHCGKYQKNLQITVAHLINSLIISSKIKQILLSNRTLKKISQKSFLI